MKLETAIMEGFVEVTRGDLKIKKLNSGDWIVFVTSLGIRKGELLITENEEEAVNRLLKG